MTRNHEEESSHGTQVFVYPWIGILANVPHDPEMSNVGSSKLRDDLSDKGLNPLEVEPLRNPHEGFTGFVLVEFSKDWPGFSNAMAFEKMFEENRCGKDDYFNSSEKGSDLYGWVARDDDYNSSGIYGEHLRNKGELKTIADLQEEEMLKLAEEHKKKIKELEMQIMEMRKKLDGKHALELEIQRLRRAFQMQEHMRNDGDEESMEEKLSVIRNNLQETEEALEDFDKRNQALTAKERENNDELQEARKEIIKELKDKTNRVIGVKRMGDLDVVPFREAVQRTLTLPSEDVEERALLLCSQWQDELSDPHWYPFKMVKVEDTEEHKQIVDSDDEKLKTLRNQWGNEPYEAVVMALKEMNEYNPSGRYPVPELWNLKENKKATLKEAVSSIVDQWKRLKRRRR